MTNQQVEPDLDPPPDHAFERLLPMATWSLLALAGLLTVVVALPRMVAFYGLPLLGFGGLMLTGIAAWAWIEAASHSRRRPRGSIRALAVGAWAMWFSWHHIQAFAAGV